MGYSIQGSGLTHQRPADVVPGEEHTHPRTTHAGGMEPHGRHGVEISERSVRLETGPPDVREY